MNDLLVKGGIIHSTNEFNKYFVLDTPYLSSRAIFCVTVQWDTTVNH